MIEGADPRRLERARRLKVEEVGNGEYLVRDFKYRYRYELQYYVDLRAETPCHCDDALRTQPPPAACKHVLACMLYERGEL